MATNQTSSISTATTQVGYCPSSMEKKRAVVMYLLIGIISGLGQKDKSEYEYFHIKQAMGWWTVFVVLLIASGILLFIPYIRYIPLLLFLAMIVILAIFIKQASDGKYNRPRESGLSAFAGMGEWILGLFEIKQSKE